MCGLHCGGLGHRLLHRAGRHVRLHPLLQRPPPEQGHRAAAVQRLPCLAGGRQQLRQLVPAQHLRHGVQGGGAMPLLPTKKINNLMDNGSNLLFSSIHSEFKLYVPLLVVDCNLASFNVLTFNH